MYGNWLPLIVYKPLVQGAALIDDSLAMKINGLSVVRTSFGGYWSLTFPITGTQNYIEEWIDGGLARHIELFNPGLECVFEGFVSEIDAQIGSLSIKRGPLLKTTTNKVKARFSTIDTSITPPAMGITSSTDWAEDADSQAKYGIIERILSLRGSTLANAEQVRDTDLAENKEPQTTEQDNISSTVTPQANITVLGYVHWLEALIYNQTAASGTQNANAKIQAVLASDPNSIFSTDYSKLTTNTTQVPQWENQDRKGLSVIKGVVGLGDGTYNRHLFGIFNNRRAIYGPIPNDVKYERKLTSMLQSVDLYGSGRRVAPWDIESGKWTFYTDLLVGRVQPSEKRLDPRYLFNEQITYTLPIAANILGAKVNRLDQMMGQFGLTGVSA